ncbi:MAG: hypothetical protein AB7G11_04900 [Phycisphaerales bacterium]
MVVESDGLRKPDGGFVFVPARSLLSAWWAYRHGHIGMRDLRVWFACWELRARRCELKSPRVGRFTAAEAAGVAGVGEGVARSSVRALERAELLRFGETKVAMGGLAWVPLEPERDDFERMLELVTNRRRKVPVPRRTIRLLANSRRPVFIATVLGQLLRCMYYRKGLCQPYGTCKASWVAAVFEVDERNVKGARGELVRMGWLQPQAASQFRLNRWGMPGLVNLRWADPRQSARPKSPLPRPKDRTLSPPPKQTGNSSYRRSENQKPGVPAPDGVRKRTGRGTGLHHITLAELRDPARLQRLLDFAQRRGVVGESESDRLQFVAAAHHAVTQGRTNPAGLFVAIVRRGLWRHLSLRDEDYARRFFADQREEWRRVTSRSEQPAVRAEVGRDDLIRDLVARSLGVLPSD